MAEEVHPGTRPDRLLLRKRHVQEWLGITDYEFRRLRERGVLRAVRGFTGEGRTYYLRDDIEQQLQTTTRSHEQDAETRI